MLSSNVPFAEGPKLEAKGKTRVSMVELSLAVPLKSAVVAYVHALVGRCPFVKVFHLGLELVYWHAVASQLVVAAFCKIVGSSIALVAPSHLNLEVRDTFSGKSREDGKIEQASGIALAWPRLQAVSLFQDRWLFPFGCSHPD